MNIKLQKIRNILGEHKEDLQRMYKVRRIGVFGSVARGDYHDRSDVDILVEFSEPIGFFTYLALEDFLRALLHEAVEVVTVRALKKAIKDDVLNETIYV